MKRQSEAGFTLVEALIAIVILVFGLIAISNLFLAAGTSNKTANIGAATTTEATEVMERIKAVPFDQLPIGGDLNSDQPSTCMEATPPVSDCFNTAAFKFNLTRTIPGVGTIRTRILVVNPNAGGIVTRFITVRSESSAAVVGGARSRSEFTTFRTCTATTGCPAI